MCLILDDLTMLLGPDRAARLLEIGVAHVQEIIDHADELAWRRCPLANPRSSLDERRTTRHVVRVVVGRWLILVVIFAAPLMLIRRQMRRPDRPVPESIRGLSWLARDYRENKGVLRAGSVIFGLGAGMVVGYGSVRLPNAGDYAREISPSFLIGLLTAVVVSTESARQVEPFAFWVVLHFGLLIIRPWRR